MPWRLCDHLRFEISIRERDATGQEERGLGQQHIREAKLEFQTEAKEFQRVVKR